MGKVLGMIPGISKIKKQIDEADIDESLLGKQEAVILSMTPKERDNPKIPLGSPSIFVMKGALNPSNVKPPATCNGSPEST